MANFIMGIISLAISVVVLANVFIFTVKNTSTAGWSASEVTMWGLLSLISIVGLVYGVMQVFGIG
jgi:hypothetical protein